MAASTMLKQQLFLDPQPGSIPPVLHLKRGTGSGSLEVCIAEGKGYASGGTRHYSILKGTRPDGTELYIPGTMLAAETTSRIAYNGGNLNSMSLVPGEYLAELTVFDTANAVARRNVSRYDTLTTAKFMIAVEENAYREEDA